MGIDTGFSQIASEFTEINPKLTISSSLSINFDTCSKSSLVSMGASLLYTLYPFSKTRIISTDSILSKGVSSGVFMV